MELGVGADQEIRDDAAAFAAARELGAVEFSGECGASERRGDEADVPVVEKLFDGGVAQCGSDFREHAFANHEAAILGRAAECSFGGIGPPRVVHDDIEEDGAINRGDHRELGRDRRRRSGHRGGGRGRAIS